MSLFRLVAFVLGTAGSVAGHGYVTSIDVDGTTYGGYLVDTYYYESDPPQLIAWSTTATDTGYVAPSAYSNSDIVCHRGAEPGALSAETFPGGSVTLYWSTWPTDHHGPVITYLANCNGDCASVDKTALEFIKIDAGGLIDNSAVPGTWASDELIAANFSRTVTIPSDIASGNYVLRHEIIALHSAENKDGAQNYPQCINLKITGSGTATPAGTLGTELYKDTDAGIYVNIWNALSSYVIPGPALYTAGSSSGNSATSSATSPATNSSPTTAAAEATTELSTATNDAVTSAHSATAIDVAEQTSVSPSQTTYNPEASSFTDSRPSATATESSSSSGSVGGSNNGHSGRHGKGGHCSARTGKKHSRLNRRRSATGRRHARDSSV
ncbi:glycosyl hydrolase family 61-domain-containing protein [Aspergillus terricola var. indicus]